MNDLTFIEMFSGGGAFRFALEYSGWKCVWANDNDKWANKIYKNHFGEGELIEADIKTINATTIPDHTLLTAGFPCQSFSGAGDRKGFEDHRGQLFFHIARIAKIKKPPLLLLENVRGLLWNRTNNIQGETFARMLQTLDGLGYWVEWQVLNSQYFGLPQHRKRVFIIGHLRGSRSRRILPIGTSSEKIQIEGEKRLKQIGTIGKNRPTNRIYDPKGLSPTLVTSGGGRHVPKILVLGNVTPSNYSDGQVVDSVGISPTLKSNIRKPKYLLTPKIIQNSRIRILTETECERLQGLPDGWTKGISRTQRIKVLGNAVSVPVIKFLGKKLKMCLIENINKSGNKNVKKLK